MKYIFLPLCFALIACDQDKGITQYNSNPEVSITSHQDGDALPIGETIVFRASASDPNHTSEQLIGTWYAGGTAICSDVVPEVSGDIYCEYVLSQGDTRISVEVKDPRNAAGSDFLDIEPYLSNTDPTCSIIEPITGQIYPEGTLSLLGQVADAEELPQLLSTLWSLNGSVLTSGNPDSSGLVVFETTDLTPGDHMLTLDVTDSGGLTCTAETSFSINGIPSIPSIVIAPDPAYTGDDLVAIASSIDPNGDVITYGYQWYKDGASSSYVQETVPSTETSVGDVWRVDVTASDDWGSSEIGSAEITIQNTVPVVDSVSISPTTVYTDTLLTSNVAFSDLDGDVVSGAYTWNVDGTPVTHSGDSLDGALFFHKGQTVSLTVIPSDGIDGGSAMTSNTVTVLNSPPGAPVIEMYAEEICSTDLTCDVVADGDDVDGDVLTYTVEWTLDGSSVTTGLQTTTWPNDTVPVSMIEEGQVWECTATPDDGEDIGTASVETLTVSCVEPGICNSMIPSYTPHVTITTTSSMMDEKWIDTVNTLGYTYNTVSQSALDSTSFYSTTDVLIVSGGTDSYSSTQISNVQGFIEQGGSVYFQSEYQCTYTSNVGVQTIVNAHGGGLTYGGTVSGTLSPTEISECMQEDLNGNTIPPLSYFWYGCASSSSSSGYEGILHYQNQDLGFAYCSNNSGYGMIISTSDQDWVRNPSNYAQANTMREQIILRLASAPISCP